MEKTSGENKMIVRKESSGENEVIVRKKKENSALEFEIAKTGFGENAKSVLVCNKKTTKDNKEFYSIQVIIDDVSNLEDLVYKVEVKKPSCGPHDANKLFRYYNLDIKKPYSMLIKYLDGSLEDLEIKNIENIFFRTIDHIFSLVDSKLKNSIIIEFKDTVKEKDIDAILTNADKIIFKIYK